MTRQATDSLSHDAGELLAEVARLRERFAAQDQLDRQLHAMVARLTELLAGAVEVRRRTYQEIDASLARCQDVIARDRAHHGDVLRSLLADVGSAQRRAIALNDAVDQLQRRLAELIAHVAAAASALVTRPADTAPERPSSPAAPAPQLCSLVIQGVPNVATALSLQRFLASLDAVATIQTREYAAGQFRLQLQLRRPLTIADLRRWPDGSLELVGDGADRLLARLIPRAAD